MSSTLPKAFDMQGLRVLITGAAGGIGSEAAKLCSQLGARTVLTDVGSTLKRMESMSSALPGVETVESLDISDRHAVEALVASHAPFDALIDTAAICPFDEDWMQPEWDKKFDRVMRVNVLGPINLVRAIMPGMIERKHGSIALCGSIAGWMGGLLAAPHYAASKGSVHALVRWFAQRATPHHVRVNAVAPGPIATGMTDGQPYNKDNYPMKRMGDPKEIANALVFLSSPAASFIAGSVMDVNGGVLMR
ncbi:MAG: 3-oxoacyl-[acyl-carrier-protein] reductase FabG [Pseudomonadota bacterium]|jgi:3-oxoacyl-[acyl-carrier protein] reductase